MALRPLHATARVNFEEFYFWVTLFCTKHLGTLGLLGNSKALVYTY